MLVLFALPLRLPLPPSLSKALLDTQSTALFFLFLQLSHSFYPPAWYMGLHHTAVHSEHVCDEESERERRRERARVSKREGEAAGIEGVRKCG